jgi:hypothetical protein
MAAAETDVTIRAMNTYPAAQMQGFFDLELCVQ